ncbi:hypothetical protein GCM10009558_111680 [Virgisporangium aurantiacum]
MLLAPVGQAVAGALHQVGEEFGDGDLVGQHDIDPPLRGSHGYPGEHAKRFTTDPGTPRVPAVAYSLLIID